MNKKAIIHVRPWNQQFVISLGKELIKSGLVNEVTLITMFVESYEYLKNNCKFSVVLIPELLKSIELDDLKIQEIDLCLQRSGPGFYDVLETERFYGAEYGLPYFKKMAILLNRFIQPEMINISFSLDHFVYYFSSSLVLSKGGSNYCFIPVGVPFNSIAVISTPKDVICNQINTQKIDRANLVKELEKPASERLQYMQPLKKNGVLKSNSNEVIRKLNREFSSGNYLVNRKYSLSEKIFHWVSKKMKLRNKRYFYQMEQIPISNKRIIYVPLHLEPEATVIMYSTYFQSQLEMLRLLVKAMPSDFVIVVKENPKMIEKRDVSFYQEINALPGVYLVDIEYPSFKLIKQSNLVVALSGTSALEALLLNIPSVLFGQPPHHQIFKYNGYGVNFGFKELRGIFSKLVSLNEFYDYKKWDEYVSSTMPYSLIPERNEFGELQLPLKKYPSRPFVNFIQETI